MLNWQTVREWCRRQRWMLVGAGVLSASVIGWTAWTALWRYESRIYAPATLTETPERPVAVVFGAGYWPSGALSDVLRDRLDAAIELYRAGRVKHLLFSGDNRYLDYNEPGKMLEYALAQGIPRTAITLDYAGRRTYDTCYRAREIFRLQEVVLVTQRYHLPRALYTCEHLGLQAVGYEADRMTYVNIRWYTLREIPALWRAWVETRITHPLPVLGNPLPIVVE